MSNLQQQVEEVRSSFGSCGNLNYNDGRVAGTKSQNTLGKKGALTALLKSLGWGWHPKNDPAQGKL